MEKDKVFFNNVSVKKNSENNKPKSYPESISLWEQSKKFFVPGGSTISKRADLYPLGAYPIYIHKSKAATVEDIDGNKYIDFISSSGAILLGHAYKEVNQAVVKQLEKGSLHSLLNPSVVKLAEKICQHIPSAERIRIMKSGADATSGAARIARAYTNRNKIISCHYHGWHDWYFASTTMNRGIADSVKDDIIRCSYGDIASLAEIIKQHPNDIAAIIMEPITFEVPPDGYFEALTKLLNKHKILLIFDEIINGFRFGLGGAQTLLGVKPDITCLSKALTNGFPLSIVCGKADILDSTQDVVTTITHAEETLSIQAALKVIEILEKLPVVEHIWEIGEYFKTSFNQLSDAYELPIKCVGYPPRLKLIFNDWNNLSSLSLKSFFLQETAIDGLLVGTQTIYITYSHTKKHVEKAIKSFERIFKMIKANVGRNLPLNGKLLIEAW